jgi:hypothetical protein
MHFEIHQGVKRDHKKNKTKRQTKRQKKKKKNTDEVAFGMLYGAQNIVFFV